MRWVLRGSRDVSVVRSENSLGWIDVMELERKEFVVAAAVAAVAVAAAVARGGNESFTNFVRLENAPDSRDAILLESRFPL